MFEAIESSDIILADVTGHPSNVMLEIGCALVHRKKMRLLLFFQSIPKFEKPPFDLTSFRREEIAEAADIPHKLKGHLEAILADARAGGI